MRALGHGACYRDRMMRVAILAGLIAASGCKPDITEDLEALADRACACKLPACADQVVDDLVALARANKNPGGDGERAVAAAQKLRKCVAGAGMSDATFAEKMKSLQAP